MSNTVREMKARMGAARVVIEGGQLSAAARASFSKVQATAVVDAIEKAAANLQPEMLAELCNFATSVPWEEPDLERILNSLSSVGTHRSRKRRRAQPSCLFSDSSSLGSLLVVVTEVGPGSVRGRSCVCPVLVWRLVWR